MPPRQQAGAATEQETGYMEPESLKQHRRDDIRDLGQTTRHWRENTHPLNIESKERQPSRCLTLNRRIDTSLHAERGNGQPDQAMEGPKQELMGSMAFL